MKILENENYIEKLVNIIDPFHH